MGKFLSTLSDIGAGASSIGSALGVAKGVFGLLKGNDNAQQVAQQKSLMDYQYKLNQSAADADNARQRSLMQDQYSINKLGQKQAGINTAFGDANSTVGAASSGSVSPPSALPAQSSIDAQYQSMIGSSAGTLSGILLNAANTRKADSEARGNEIDNQTRALENLARIRQMIASAKNDEEKAKYQEMANEIMKKFGLSNAALENSIKGSQAHIEEANAAVQGQLNEAELNKKLAELELSKKNGAKVDEEINKVKAEIKELQSRTHLNNTQAGLNVANTGKVNSETKFNNDTMFDREEQVRLQNVPKDTKELLMRNDWIRKYLDCVEHGKPVPYEVEWHCDKLLVEYGLRDSNYQGISAGTIINAILR